MDAVNKGGRNGSDYKKEGKTEDDGRGGIRGTEDGGHLSGGVQERRPSLYRVRYLSRAVLGGPFARLPEAPYFYIRTRGERNKGYNYT